jgi:hypothetical protein
MEEKAYMLMTSSGEYDDYVKHIIGIYGSIEMAEEGKREYKESLAKFFEANPCPVDDEIARKIESYEISIEDDDNPSIELYNDWVYKTEGVSTMCKDPWIIEMVLNKTNLKIIEDRIK